MFISLPEYLKYYRSLGFALIPVRPKTKIPAVKWKKFYNKGYTEADFLRFCNQYWFTQFPYNVAVCCDINGIVGIDFDSEQAYYSILEPKRVEKKALVVRTPGGGYHVYFRSVKTVYTCKYPTLKIEIHGKGSIMILPPSIHPSGQPYQLISAPPELPTVEDLGAEFEKIIKLKTGHNPIRLGDFIRAPRIKPYRGKHPPCIKKLLVGVEKGFRNEACCRIYTYYRRVRGWPQERITRLLLKWNKSNIPPLPESEIHNIIKSMERHGYEYGCTGLADLCSWEDCPFCPKFFGEEPRGLFESGLA